MTRTPPDAARRRMASRWIRRVTVAMLWVACLNLLAAVALDLATFVVPFDRGSDASFLPSFLLAFPLFGWGIFVVNAVSAAGTPPGERPAPTRADAVGAVVLVVLFGVIVAVSGLPGMGTGQPGYDPATGHYTSDDHGSVHVISHAAYLRAVAGQIRLFLGGAILFTALAAAFLHNYLQAAGGWQATQILRRADDLS